MGLYDTIYFHCPNCGFRVEAQSKSGPCNLGVYKHLRVPSDVAVDANRHAPHQCSKCGMKWEFLNTIELVRLEVVEYDSDGDASDEDGNASFNYRRTVIETRDYTGN